MKFTAGLLASIAGSVAAETSIKADSPFGLRLLENARKLEQNQNQNVNAQFDNYWVAGYSLKFEGCHHISQWNDEAEGEEDVRVATKRLVRFRLCPTDFCDKGCGSGYGDYIVDMNTYIESWMEAKQAYQEFKCEYLEQNVCYCENNGNENWDEDMCMWDCYASHNMEGICMDDNPYNYNNEQQANQMEFELAEYMECSQANIGQRRLQEGWDGNYYIGPYCAEQGGAIYLGMFSDDSCTTPADEKYGANLYYALTGTNLPYSGTNIIDVDCLACKEPDQDQNQNQNQQGNDQQDPDDVAEVCENIYTMAGKCEINLPQGTTYQPNNNACNYMKGIKIVRSDGTVFAQAKANKTASAFIGIFAVSFVLLTMYVYYLKTKLDRASINLAE